MRLATAAANKAVEDGDKSWMVVTQVQRSTTEAAALVEIAKHELVIEFDCNLQLKRKSHSGGRECMPSPIIT